MPVTMSIPGSLSIRCLTDPLAHTHKPVSWSASSMRMKSFQRVILKDASPVTGGRHNEGVIRVLIADDQELVRTGFRVILEAEGDIQVVAEADNGKEAVRQAALTKPQVVLMDIRMPELDGLAATEQILRQQDPPT